MLSYGNFIFKNKEPRHDACKTSFQAFIVENAGGKSSDGTKPTLDIVPTSLHVRSPIILGSTDDVDDVLKIIEKHSE